jgi:hypothetical protein
MEDDVAALRKKLSRGRYCSDGLKLTREECFFLWEILTGQRKLPRSRGPKPDLELLLRPEAIATLTALYEAKGLPTKVAVANVMQRYGVSRSQVFAARRQHPKQIAGIDPVWLDGLISWHESIWQSK